jgi:hypothetical protein
MHARVTTVQLRPDTLDASIDLYQQEILPVIKAQPGYQGVYLFTDRATGNGSLSRSGPRRLGHRPTRRVASIASSLPSWPLTLRRPRRWRPTTSR